MRLDKIRHKISKFPGEPGVYKFMKGGKVLYVGKATSLRDRVRSYFNTNITETRGPLIEKMIRQFDDIKFIKTDSVLEAIILEANLIKKYLPEANTKEKDNKSFNYVVITQEDFPRVLVMRGRELERENNSPTLATLGPSLNLREWKGRVRTFGPFPNGTQLKDALKIVRKMFPFRDKCKVGAKRGCFNYQIGLCPGVCVGAISQEEYAKTIKNIVLFFESNKKKLIKNLEKQMKDFAKSREFEKAQKIKKTIFTLNHIQDVALIKESSVSRFNLDIKFRIESYDIAHLSGTNMVGAMVVVEDGEMKKSDYRKFKIRNNIGADDTKALSEVLTRRLEHGEWPLPNLIVVDGGIAQKKAVERVLRINKINIPVVSVVKDERHKPRDIIGIKRLKDLKIENLEGQILLSNAEAHRFAIGFHKQLRGKIFKK